MALKVNTVVCLQSMNNNKYLRYQKGQQVQIHGLVQFDGDDILDRYVQFEVVQAECGDDFVHLRALHNNKFLVRWSPHQYVIGAFAGKPEEDQSSWMCTLFKPIPVPEDGSKTRLLHVQLDRYAMLLTSQHGECCLMAEGADLDIKKSRDVFIVDCFPKKVAFRLKNDELDNYLGASLRDGIPYIEYLFDTPTDAKVLQEIIPVKGGLVCIKSSHFNKFWKTKEPTADHSKDWHSTLVVADADDPRVTNDNDALFKVEVLGNNRVALIHMGNKKYCCHEYDKDVPGGFAAKVEVKDIWTPMDVTYLP